MIRRLRLVYPLLIAVYPTLWITSVNPGEYRAPDLVTVVAVELAFGSVLYGLTALILKRRSYASTIVAGIAALATGWFFLYLPLSQSVANVLSGSGIEMPSLKATHLLVVPIAGLLTLGLALWMLVRRPVLEAATNFLALIFVLLVSHAVGTVLRNEIRAHQTLRETSVARKLDAAIPKREDRGNGTEVKRDIYLIVLDMYANSRTLRDYLLFDNRPFEDTLRTLGFTLPTRVMSNYNYTSLSIASILNMDYVGEVKEEHETNGLGLNLAYHLIENNRLMRFLKDEGYRIVFFPSPAWKGTRNNRLADDRFDGGHRGIRRQLVLTDLRREVVYMTLLPWLGLRFPPFEAKHAMRSFSGVGKVATRPEPTFAFAHFYVPHPPYVLDAECQDLRSTSSRNDDSETPGGKEAYLAQLKCVNQRVLEMVREILSGSDAAPIILLQGDHGTRTVRHTRGLPGDTITAAEVRERLGAFGAYHLPSGGASELGDSVTVVNVMRHVLNYYFGADLPPLPDSLFYSLHQRYFEFFPVSVNGGRVPREVSSQGSED